MTEGIRRLKEQSRNLVIVTNEVFSESVPDSVEMKNYKKVLGEINRNLAGMADQVTEVVYGIPCIWKKDADCTPGRLVESAVDHYKENTMKNYEKTGKDPERKNVHLIIGGAFQENCSTRKRYIQRSAGMMEQNVSQSSLKRS